VDKPRLASTDTWGVRGVGEQQKTQGTPHMAMPPTAPTTKPVKPTVPTVPLSKVAAELAEKTGMTKKDATGALDEFVGLIVKHLKKGNKVRITGLGILQVRNRPARMGRNPATGEAIKIKASKKVAFRVAKDLKEAV
jgi:DNA-binding protein HU-beta